MIPRDEEATKMTKQETSTTTSTSSTTWSGARSKDPRIVRVSRAFGGKDRHSKVCTVRGLRDRRVRLSVPTAIQLYDLQDRLGLSQPSKVVDWLLDAAKHEIDELPPLQFPPGGLIGPGFNAQPMMMMGFQQGLGGKSKSGETSVVDWESTNQGDDQVNDFFGRQNYQFNNNNSSFVRSTWDHEQPLDNVHDHQTSISLGLAANHDQNHHHHDLHSFGFLQPNQVLAYHHQQQQAGISTSTQPYFPNNDNTQFDPNKDSDNVRPFQFSMTANLLPLHNNAVSDDHENKHNDL